MKICYVIIVFNIFNILYPAEAISSSAIGTQNAKIIQYKKILIINQKLNKCLKNNHVSLEEEQSKVLYKRMENIKKKTIKYCKINQRKQAENHYNNVMKDYKESYYSKTKERCLKEQDLTQEKLNEMSFNAIGVTSTDKFHSATNKNGHICDNLSK